VNERLEGVKGGGERTGGGGGGRRRRRRQFLNINPVENSTRKFDISGFLYDFHK
jgi:hypothetical protein